MAEAKFIDPAAPVSPGLDFVALRDRGIKIAQQLAGDSWTDYNEHDPGVTTLEQLCYALTDLAYRAELPIEDLLAEPGTNAIDARRQRLFAPQAILPCNPLTVNDYRKLIVDRVPSVANAWLSAHASTEPGAVNGLYEIELYVPYASRDAATIGEMVRRVYGGLRGLCEDVQAVHVLEPVATALSAKISIDPAAAPERVLARVLYEAGNFFAPEIRRQPLDALMAGGGTLASIFSGPLPGRGFIADEQLQPRPDSFTAGDVTRVLLNADGVIGVRDVGVAISGARVDTSRSDSPIPVPRRSILRLAAGPVDRAFGIRLFAGEVECRLNAGLVQRELDRLWSEHRRTYDLRAEFDRRLEAPRGRAVDVGEYYSLQNQFPAIYGVNEHGVPPDASQARQAQARQFKAYLLVFEQLIADAQARLASATRGAFRGPIHQYLDESVPDVAPLLKSSYRAGLRQIVEDPDEALKRRNRFLDARLAAYGEAWDPIAPPPTAGVHGMESAVGAIQARGKIARLGRLPRLRSSRGTACDYLAPPSPENVAGLEIQTRIQLGMSAATPRELDAWLDSLGVKAIVDAAPIADREAMMRHARHIGGTFTPLVHLEGAAPSGDVARQVEISEELLVAAADPSHYRIGVLPGETGVTVVCRAPSQPLWQMAGRYPDESRARSGASALLERARAVDRHARRLYIVEHTLLRFGQSSEAQGAGGAGFEHSFTMSAIVCVPAREARDPGYRQHVCDVLRENTPAHIAVNSAFLRLSRVAKFERLYWDWRRALTTPQDADALASRCRDLRAFLSADRP